MLAKPLFVIVRPAVLIMGVLALLSPVGAEELTLVVCAPGYPGSTVEAQPAMDGFATAVAGAAGWRSEDFAAVYFETDSGGVERFADSDAGLAMATLPFFLEHRSDFDLRPFLIAVPEGRQPVEPWVLVAGVGAIEKPADLEGWEIISLAGHSPRFVRGPALGDWGEIPEGVKITFSGAVLTSLRKAARGESVAVLLDAEQAAALDRLPFAGDLEVVHRSRPLPASVLCTVGDRVDSDALDEIRSALEILDECPEAAEALAGVRLDRFEPTHSAVIAAVQEAFDGAGE